MNFYTKRFFSLLFTLILSLCLITGCQIKNDSTLPETSTQQETTTATNEFANEAFDRFLTDTFKEMVTSDSLSLHFGVKDPSSFGIAPIAPTFGNFSFKDMQAEQKQLKALRKQLHSFSKQSLSTTQQYDYIILNSALSSSIKLNEYYYYDTILSPVIGLQAQLPVLLAEYRFDTKNDIEDYLLLLADLPRYFEQILQFEREKSSKGYGMQDFALDDIIAQCEDFLQQLDSNEHFLITSFEHRLKELEETTSLSTKQREDFKKTNEYIIKNHIKSAYESMVDTLTSLEGKATIEGGLCHLPKGKAYYQTLVSSLTGTDLSIEEIETQIKEQLKKGQLDTLAILKKYPNIFDEYEKATCPITEPTEILSTLEEEITKEFPKAPSTSCELKTVDASLAEHLSPAFYFIPPVDNIDSNVIYINSLSSSYEEDTLYPTLAHEGYPGHLYQNTYFYSQNPNPIRSVLNFGGYSEGWATYVEYHSYESIDYGNHSKEIARLNQYEMDLSLAMCTLLDIGVNYHGWTEKDCSKFLEQYGIIDPSTSVAIYQSVIEEPANYLQYYVGFLQFERLRQQLEDSDGETFDPLSFHTTILDLGPAPFSLIQQVLDSH